jgi:translation initiation factor 3 subunit B
MLTSSDPNMGNVAPGVVVKNNVDFYHLDPKKGDFRLMRECSKPCRRWTCRSRY